MTDTPIADRIVQAASKAIHVTFGEWAPEGEWDDEARAAAVAVLREWQRAVEEWPNGQPYIPGRDPMERMRDSDLDAWLQTLADEIEQGGRDA